MSGKAKSALELLQKAFKTRISGDGFDRHLSKVKILRGGNGECCAKLKVEKEHLNVGGSLHGGFTASLVDSVSTLALLTAPRGLPGASVDLKVSFMKAAKINDVIVIDARATKVGKNLAFLSVDITKEECGSLVAHGEHIKFMS